MGENGTAPGVAHLTVPGVAEGGTAPGVAHLAVLWVAEGGTAPGVAHLTVPGVAEDGTACIATLLLDIVFTIISVFSPTFSLGTALNNWAFQSEALTRSSTSSGSGCLLACEELCGLV